jgi:hypothetical protein
MVISSEFEFLSLELWIHLLGSKFESCNMYWVTLLPQNVVGNSQLGLGSINIYIYIIYCEFFFNSLEYGGLIVGSELERKRNEAFFTVWTYFLRIRLICFSNVYVFSMWACVPKCNAFNTSVWPKTDRECYIFQRFNWFSSYTGIHCCLDRWKRQRIW